MGPTKLRGIGSANGIVGNGGAPAAPGNGSGGPGTLPGTSISFAPALGELGDITTGRVTLAAVNLTILAMLGFYYWTRSAQGGG